MAKSDWLEVIELFNNKNKDYLNNFLLSKALFCPNKNHLNIFDNKSNAFSAKILNKPKPGNWIPVYKKEDLSSFLIENSLMPIRSGQGEFFFFKGNIFFDLSNIQFDIIDICKIVHIDSFVPLTLKNFHKNENAYLNKALAIGLINNFVDSNDLEVFQKELKHLKYRRLLYGQFGKIKTNFELNFQTTKGTKTINKGFQFEIDLVLENKNEIIIFEAKQGINKRKTFSLLQLYYPLIYLSNITKNKKKIRTIFIDIETKLNEIYRLVEFEFINLQFDNYKVLKCIEYS